MEQKYIRNFCIIAHIDHGKSTLADRILQLTGAIDKGKFHDQFLDNMDLERERGITIKSSAVRITYKSRDNNTYILNLIDTPGHVDFSFEVSKTLAASDGAVLVVDAAQGVEAQTVANFYIANSLRLKLIPVINKIDLPNAKPDEVKLQLKELTGVPIESIILISAKVGKGIEEILEKIVRVIPPPKGNPDAPLQALIFDSKYDTFKGVIIYVRIANGEIRKDMNIKMFETGKTYQVQEVGVFKPEFKTIDILECGSVGYIICNIRNPQEVINGDTVISVDNPALSPLPGYQKAKPMVFCGIYPQNSKDYLALREAMEKLKLNDASFIYQPESTTQLGMGFRCGFLGLLHMEITQERLEREYGMNLLITTPQVVYQIRAKNGDTIELDNIAKMPERNLIDKILEPIITTFIMIPPENLGQIMEFSIARRGIYKSTQNLEGDRLKLIYEFPLSEIIVDFYDKVKTITKGYGSIDYEFKEYRPSDLVKLDILINQKPQDILSFIVRKDKAYVKGKALVSKLKELIPRQLFEVVIQASIGSKIIAKESVRPIKKHVTGKCYGGDITRKRKLWEKQKIGKKKMKKLGNVEVPQEAFIAVLKL